MHLNANPWNVWMQMKETAFTSHINTAVFGLPGDIINPASSSLQQRSISSREGGCVIVADGCMTFQVSSSVRKASSNCHKFLHCKWTGGCRRDPIIPSTPVFVCTENSFSWRFRETFDSVAAVNELVLQAQMKEKAVLDFQLSVSGRLERLARPAGCCN